MHCRSNVLSWVWCCLMTHDISKDIRCHVWPLYAFLCLHTTKVDIRPQVRWTVNLAIADDHINLPLVNILTLSPLRMLVPGPHWTELSFVRICDFMLTMQITCIIIYFQDSMESYSRTIQKQRFQTTGCGNRSVIALPLPTAASYVQASNYTFSHLFLSFEYRVICTLSTASPVKQTNR